MSLEITSVKNPTIIEAVNRNQSLCNFAKNSDIVRNRYPEFVSICNSFETLLGRKVWLIEDQILASGLFLRIKTIVNDPKYDFLAKTNILECAEKVSLKVCSFIPFGGAYGGRGFTTKDIFDGNAELSKIQVVLDQCVQACYQTMAKDSSYRMRLKSAEKARAIEQEIQSIKQRARASIAEAFQTPEQHLSASIRKCEREIEEHERPIEDRVRMIEERLRQCERKTDEIQERQRQNKKRIEEHEKEIEGHKRAIKERVETIERLRANKNERGDPLEDNDGSCTIM